MITRKYRLILLSIYFFMFTILCVFYFSKTSFTPEEDAEMMKLILYVFFIFIVSLFVTWFKVGEKDSPRYQKYFLLSIGILLILLIPILFKDMFF